VPVACQPRQSGHLSAPTATSPANLGADDEGGQDFPDGDDFVTSAIGRMAGMSGAIDCPAK
jgi:hypothetical protein